MSTQHSSLAHQPHGDVGEERLHLMQCARQADSPQDRGNVAVAVIAKGAFHELAGTIGSFDPDDHSQEAVNVHAVAELVKQQMEEANPFMPEERYH